MTDATQEPNIVREFTARNAHIIIADNYCRDKRPEDIKKALREIARKAQASLSAAAVESYG